MDIMKQAVSTITHHRVRSFFCWLVTVVSFFILTNFTMLRAIVKQLHKAQQIHLFTTVEAQELQRYFTFQLINYGLFFFVLIAVTLIIRTKWTGHDNRFIREKIKVLVAEYAIQLVLAAGTLLLFFVLFEPFYESTLQSMYLKGIDHFTNLPTYILSNGNSGIAYSIRSSLMLDLPTSNLFHLFSLSLFGLCLIVFVVLAIEWLFLRSLAAYTVKKAR